MKQELESLFSYCKSKGYKRSRKEFDQELRELIEEIDSDNLSEVAGGNKQTKAAVAGLFSALSIASPFASAAQIVSTNKATNKSSVATNFNNYKNNIANKAREGVNYIKNNVKKDSVQDILIRYGLPVGGTLATSSILIPLGLLAKNKIANQNKVYSFYKQLLCSSYEQWAKFFVNQIKKYDTEWINYDVYKKHNMLLQRLNLSLPLDSTVDHESYSNLYNEIEKDIIKNASKATSDGVDFDDNLVGQFNNGVKEILGSVDDATTKEAQELEFIKPQDLILFLQNSGHTSLVKELGQDKDVKKALETAISNALEGETAQPVPEPQPAPEPKDEDPAVAAKKELENELNKPFETYKKEVDNEFDNVYRQDKSRTNMNWKSHHEKHLKRLESLTDNLKSGIDTKIRNWVMNRKIKIDEQILNNLVKSTINAIGVCYKDYLLRIGGNQLIRNEENKLSYIRNAYENQKEINKFYNSVSALINNLSNSLIQQSNKTAQ